MSVLPNLESPRTKRDRQECLSYPGKTCTLPDRVVLASGQRLVGRMISQVKWGVDRELAVLTFECKFFGG
jgi:hypothetical protein